MNNNDQDYIVLISQVQTTYTILKVG